MTAVLASNRLHGLEAVIERGLQTFVNVGNALRDIRDEKLYADRFDTFEAYCKERWGMERRHAYRLMDGAQVTETLRVCPIGHTALPVTESQARPLTKLKADQQPAAWERAVEKAGAGNITAKVVEEAVAEILGTAAPEPTEPVVGSTDPRIKFLRDAARSLREAKKLSRGEAKSRLNLMLETVQQLINGMEDVADQSGENGQVVSINAARRQV